MGHAIVDIIIIIIIWRDVLFTVLQFGLEVDGRIIFDSFVFILRGYFGTQALCSHT